MEELELEDELVAGLSCFVRLCEERGGRVHAASRGLRRAAARVRDSRPSATGRGLLAACGGALGAACGGAAGAVAGALGAVAAATCFRLCGEINAVGATVGFVGSVLGGVAGGVFAGSVGGTVCAAAEASGRPCRVGVVWLTVGSTAGGAIGGIFGGRVGAAGGAVGGGLGALHGTRFTGHFVGAVARHLLGAGGSNEATSAVRAVQEAGDEFCEAVNPLVEELRTVQATCDKVNRVDVRRVAGQAARTLAAADAAAKAMARTADATDFVPRAEDAARRSERVAEELEETRTEAGRLLGALKTR